MPIAKQREVHLFLRIKRYPGWGASDGCGDPAAAQRYHGAHPVILSQYYFNVLVKGGQLYLLIWRVLDHVASSSRYTTADSSARVKQQSWRTLNRIYF
ncbi:MAG TPA: hypothetical protein VLE46_16070 [Nitrospira sp.]|nr:hypothetical protein [Nitrospira sp.]